LNPQREGHLLKCPQTLIAPTVIQVDKPDVELLSASESPITGGAPTEKVGDGKKQGADNILTGASDSEAAFSGHPPMHEKAKFVRRMLTSDYSKVDGELDFVVLRVLF
jgi:hypothetical protein